MLDDHDRCQWVNVSSGTGLPGFSRTNPDSRKLVLCVCLCVYLSRRTDQGHSWSLLPYFTNKWYECLICFAGSTESFSHLCLLQGILSHADNHTLALVPAENEDIVDLCSPILSTCQFAKEHHTDDECGSMCFLLGLLPAVKQLCMSAKFKYHAFRLLDLWISRMKLVYQDSSENLHSENKWLESVENDLLELLTGHMDCRVDGVTELIGELLNSVMQLDKLLCQHTS